jgi:hypothetical protein
MWKVFMSRSPHSGTGIHFDSSMSPLPHAQVEFLKVPEVQSSLLITTVDYTTPRLYNAFLIDQTF